MPGDLPAAEEASMQDVVQGDVPLVHYVQQRWAACGGTTSMLVVGGALVCTVGVLAAYAWHRRR